MRLELEPGGGGVRVALTPQSLAEQEPRELALWAGAHGGAQGGADVGGACGYRGVVRLTPDAHPLPSPPDPDPHPNPKP